MVSRFVCEDIRQTCRLLKFRSSTYKLFFPPSRPKTAQRQIMGWLWNSSTSNSPSNPSNPQDQLRQSSHADPSTTTPTTSSVTTNDAPFPTEQDLSSTTPPPRTRDQVANDEVLAFFRNLEVERQRAAGPPPQDDDDDDGDDDDVDDEPPELLTPARLYDTRARCVGLLDTAWLCASPGGQVCTLLARLQSCPLPSIPPRLL